LCIDGNKNWLTLNIFLNDEFNDGETDFLNHNNELVIRAKPKTGRAVLFDRNWKHRGNKVLNGYKYLLRTDVMYDELL
jgi:hypothetical protein